MKNLWLVFIVASCAGFNKEDTRMFVDIVIATKHLFSSGCVYILHDEVSGKCKHSATLNPFLPGTSNRDFLKCFYSFYSF
jgi:hypothetical protein